MTIGREMQQEVIQDTLFAGVGILAKSPASNNDSHFTDPAFASNKVSPIHRWVPWIAGFSCEFVRNAIKKYLLHSGTVLDPFCGVGTTLVEALMLGHKAIGFEINPYAALASRTKASAHLVDVDQLYRYMLKFKLFFNQGIDGNYVPKSQVPQGFKTRAPFYSPSVLKKVLVLLDFTETIEDPRIRDLFRLAFASTMVRYSNYSYEPSLGRRVSSGKEEIEDFPVDQTILNKLSEMAEDIGWYKEVSRNQLSQAQVIGNSFFDYQSCLEPESVDLVITSPPYLNNYHYNRNTRPHLYWLNFATCPKDFQYLEHTNFGKYWQTVREKDQINLDFSAEGTDLLDRIGRLRQERPDKGIYGGAGWANYAASYFNDCLKFARGLAFSLKRGGTALVVIGNSILQGVMIPTDEYFAKIAETAGLKILRIDIPRQTRVGNSIIRSQVRVAKAKDSHRLYEAIVELRKP